MRREEERGGKKDKESRERSGNEYKTRKSGGAYLCGACETQQLDCAVHVHGLELGVGVHPVHEGAVVDNDVHLYARENRSLGERMRG